MISIRGECFMNNRLKSKLVPYSIVAFVVLTTLSVFQNCSKVSFDPVDPKLFEASSSNPLYADGKMGESINLPELKLFFVIDNSFTMSTSNIKLSDAFNNLFNGSNASNLALFNTEITLISTAQNLSGSPSADRRNPLVAELLTHNYAGLQMRTPNDLNQQERQNSVTGVIPGDLVGYELNQQANAFSGKDILFSPASVVGLKANVDGTVLFETSIKKPQNASIDTLINEFRARMDLLNPNRNHITDGDVYGPAMSNESGLCAMARLMKDNSKFMKSSDIVSFILVSDEDDVYNAGENCLDSFKQVPKSGTFVSGTCNYTDTTINFKYNKTKVKYSYTIPATTGTLATQAKCTITKENGFEISYNIAWQDTVTTTSYTYSTPLSYYLEVHYTQDNIPKVRYDGPTSTTVAVDLTGKCNQSNISQISGLPSNIAYDATHKPVCGTTTTTPHTDTSHPERAVANGLSSKALFNNKATLLTDSALVANGLTADTVAYSCNDACLTKLKTMIRAKDSRFSGHPEYYFSGEFKISKYYFDDGAAAKIQDNITVSSQAACDSYKSNATASGLKINEDFTAGSAGTSGTGASTGNSDYTVDEPITSCSTLCSNTYFCKDKPAGTTVSQALASATGQPGFACTGFETVDSGFVNFKSGGGGFDGAYTCDTQCKDTNICPTSGTMTVKDYVTQQKALEKKVVTGCEAPKTPGSTSFASEPSTYKCPRGTISYTNQNQILPQEAKSFVSGTKDNGAVDKDLISFISGKTEEVFGDNKPFFNFFVMTHEDATNGLLREQQTEGANYVKLSDLMRTNGAKSGVTSILSTNYGDSLKDLSEIIRIKVGRSIFFPQVESWHMIRKVWVNNYQMQQGKDWTASGGTVNFKDGVKVERLDKVTIQFY